MKADGVRREPLRKKFQRHALGHFTDNDPPLIKMIAPGQNLPAADAFCMGAVGADIGDGGGLPAPGVIDEQLRIHAEGPVEHILVRRSQFSHAVYPHAGEPCRRTGAHAPEIRNGPVLPEKPPVALLCEPGYAAGRMFGENVQRDLGQVQIGAYAAGGGDAGLGQNIVHDHAGKFFRTLAAIGEIIGGIDKNLVDRIDMHVFPGGISEINGVDPGRIVHIEGHSGWGHDVINARRDLKNPAAVFDAQGFHGRGDGQTYGFLRPLRVRHNKAGRHGVKPPLRTLHRGIE